MHFEFLISFKVITLKCKYFALMRIMFLCFYKSLFVMAFHIYFNGICFIIGLTLKAPAKMHLKMLSAANICIHYSTIVSIEANCVRTQIDTVCIIDFVNFSDD